MSTSWSAVKLRVPAGLLANAPPVPVVDSATLGCPVVDYGPGPVHHRTNVTACFWRRSRKCQTDGAPSDSASDSRCQSLLSRDGDGHGTRYLGAPMPSHWPRDCSKECLRAHPNKLRRTPNTWAKSTGGLCPELEDHSTPAVSGIASNAMAPLVGNLAPRRGNVGNTRTIDRGDRPYSFVCRRRHSTVLLNEVRRQQCHWSLSFVEDPATEINNDFRVPVRTSPGSPQAGSGTTALRFVSFGPWSAFMIAPELSVKPQRRTNQSPRASLIQCYHYSSTTETGVFAAPVLVRPPHSFRRWHGSRLGSHR